VREVIAAVEKVTGKKVPVKLGTRRAGDPAELVASSAKIMKAFGWRPKYLEIEQILETAWKWHKTRPRGFRTK
jgi:UDP-glucose 4-epimerase